MHTVFKFRLHCLGLAITALMAGCATQHPSFNGASDAGVPGPGPKGVTTTTAEARSNEAASNRALGEAAAAKPRQKVFPGNDKVVELQARRSVGAKGEAISLNFDRAPLADVVHSILGDILKKPYSIEAELPGEVTLRTARPVPLADVGMVLESTLSVRGLGMVTDAAGTVHIGPGDALKAIPAGLGQSVGRSVSVVPLQHIGAREMADILKPMAAADAILRVDTVRNLLMLQGNQAQTETWLDLVYTFDVDSLAGMSVGVFPLENADAKEMAKILEMVTAKGENPLEGVYRIVPIERLNSLLVIVPRRHLLESVKQWIERIDQSSDSALLPQLHVYPVQKGSAIQLSKVLGAIYGGKTGSSDASRGALAPGLNSATASTNRNSIPSAQAGATSTSTASRPSTLTSSGTGGLTGATSAAAGATTSPATGAVSSTGPATIDLDGDVRIVADDSTNTLLVYAPKRAYQRIESALRQLDVSPAQVLIEATIVEVTLNDTLQYGLQWYFSDTLGGRLAGKTGVGTLTTGTSSATPSKVLPGFNYTISDSAGGIRAVLNALSSETGLKVVSSPSLLVLDNQSAEIRVGNQQPILSATTTSTVGNVTQSVTYKDTGVLLRVTPRVNSGGVVTLDIAQEVTDVGAIDQATNQRSFLQRSLQSRISVPSGQTAVLGGLIKDNTSNSRAGLPLLSQIPIIGAAFGSTEKKVDRTELLVILTPRVLENSQQLKEVSDEIRTRMLGVGHGVVAK
jgi:general secretion pathway protein D